MKNMSRAYNRHKQHAKFIRRVKNWLSTENALTDKNVKDALKGETFIFLRTTGRPCNCYGCTYKKYKRTPKHKRVNLKDNAPLAQLVRAADS